jgi:hypothetical protein
MGEAKRRKAEIDTVKSLESRSLTRRYATTSPKSVDLSQGFVTFENLPWLPPDSLRLNGIPIRHPRLKVGIHNSLFVDEPTSQDTFSFFRSLERFCNESGWTMEDNPLFWRYITEIVRAFASRSESKESLLHSLGIGGGSIYSISHITIVYDFLLRNHTKMGDHAIPLLQRLIAWLDFDPVGVKEIIHEIMYYGERGRLSVDEKFRLKNELLQCERPIGTHPQAKQEFLRLASQAMSGGKSILTLLLDSPESETFSGTSLIGLEDYFVLQCTFSKQLPSSIDPRKLQLLKTAKEEDFNEIVEKQLAYDQAFEELPEPLTVYKGCVLLKKEFVRAAFGGKRTPNFSTLGKSHRDRLGPCFTLSPLVAEWFALKTAANLPNYLMEFAHHYPALQALAGESLRPAVIKYQVPRSAVLGFQAIRGEAEIIVSDIDQLKVIHYDFVYPKGKAQEAIGKFSGPHALYQARLSNPSKSHAKNAGLTWSPYLNKSNTMVDLIFDVFGLLPPTLHKKLVK